MVYCVTIPERASVTANSLWGRSKVTSGTIGTGNEGNNRQRRAQNKNLIIMSHRVLMQSPSSPQHGTLNVIMGTAFN
jgi:hypothetical protein